MATRRALLIALAGTVSAVLLPPSWTKPVVEWVIVPAHADASPISTTTTTATTTATTTVTTTATTTTAI